MPRRRGLDPNALARIRDDLSRGLLDTRPAAPEDPEEFVAPSFIASGHDIGPYPVAKADNYYQGPHLSTRVAAHSFLPVDEDGVPYVVKNTSTTYTEQPKQGGYQLSEARYGKTRQSVMADFEHGPYGLVFVKWQKPGPRGSVWVYGITQPVPLSVYRTFRDYYSKGRAVVHMLEQYGHDSADTNPYVKISGVMDV